MSNNQNGFVIVPVKVHFSANGEVVQVDQPDLEDVKLSHKVIGSVTNKDKVIGLLNKYGSMLKGFLR